MKRATGFVADLDPVRAVRVRHFPKKITQRIKPFVIIFGKAISRTEAGGDGFCHRLRRENQRESAFSLFFVCRLLNSNKVPSTGFGVGGLYVCRVTYSVAVVVIEFDVTGHALVLHAPKSFVDSLRIDDDKVCLTNINRQIYATRKTIGQYKVDVAAERIAEINPEVLPTSTSAVMPFSWR